MCLASRQGDQSTFSLAPKPHRSPNLAQHSQFKCHRCFVLWIKKIIFSYNTCSMSQKCNWWLVAFSASCGVGSWILSALGVKETKAVDGREINWALALPTNADIPKANGDSNELSAVNKYGHRELYSLRERESHGKVCWKCFHVLTLTMSDYSMSQVFSRQ